MRNIVVLDKVIADQIAAGEVVERPASVLKELLENSLDAGADSIEVDIEAGGVGRIRVRDNGAGFPPGELATAFLRHATSKIRDLSDLEAIGTFGFRGEALASIASVAKVVVETRSPDRPVGERIAIEGGQVVEERETGCPPGTLFDVADLFFNVPARRKFLKREATEASHCLEAVVRAALVRPAVRFRVRTNGRLTKDLLRVETRFERVRALFPNEPLAQAEGQALGVGVRAVLGPPQRARAGTGSLYTFVNGRYVKDKTLWRAVTQAFGGTLDSGRYPAGAVYIDVPPKAVDVNVHPQKIEVRFADPGAVFKAISLVVGTLVQRSAWSVGPAAASDAVQPGGGQAEAAAAPDHDGDSPRSAGQPPQLLSGARWAPPAPRTATPPGRVGDKVAEQRAPFAPGASAAPAPLPQAGAAPSVSEDAHRIHSAQGDDGAPDAAETGPFSSLRYIGQGGDTFLLCDRGDALVIIDQHAAHERVTYEKLRAEWVAGGVRCQRLLSPVVVELGPEQAERIAQQRDALARLGLDVERQGPDRVAVHGVPASVTQLSPESLLAQMVIALEEGREDSRGAAFEHALATMACHGSVRAGRAMDPREVRALFAQMDTIDMAGHCPHGRPVVYAIAWSEIRKKVGR